MTGDSQYDTPVLLAERGLYVWGDTPLAALSLNSLISLSERDKIPLDSEELHKFQKMYDIIFPTTHFISDRVYHGYVVARFGVK